MRIGDGHDVIGMDAASLEQLRRPPDLGPQPVGDLGIADPDPGIEQDDAGRMPNGIHHDEAGLTGQRAIVRVDEVCNAQRLHEDVGRSSFRSHGPMVSATTRRGRSC